MSINPALKLKLDELFLRWLTDPATQKVLHENLVQLKAEDSLQSMLAVSSGVVVAPMCASVYGYFYGLSNSDSPIPNTEILPTGLPSSLTSASSRPNTPPHFPQPPHVKIFGPRSPRRHSSVGTAHSTSGRLFVWQLAVCLIIAMLLIIITLAYQTTRCCQRQE